MGDEEEECVGDDGGLDDEGGMDDEGGIGEDEVGGDMSP
jgi:hypothetical protein